MADARRKKVIVFNKDDLRRSADDIRKEFEKVESTGRSSARGVQEEFEKVESTGRSSARGVQEEFEKVESTGRSSARGVQEAFEGLGKKASTALNEAFSGNTFTGLKDIEDSLRIQRQAVDDLTEQYKKAKAEFDSVNLGTQDERLIAKREKASALYRQVSAELKGEEELLKKQEEAFKLISTELQAAGDKSVTFYTQMRQIREEMNKLALAGKDQTPEYDRLRSKLDEVSVAYRKVQQEQQMLAKYGNMLIPGLIQGMSGLAGAFSVYQGVSSLFIKDNEKLAEVQTKLQSAMALTIGLQQVQQTLHSTSEFRIGVVRKATQAWTTAQNALNTSLGISKGLAGAFMAGGIMALVAGVGYLITKYRDWSKEQERLKTIQREFNNVMLEGRKNAQKDIVSLDFLYKATQDQTKSQKERLKAAKELQRLYPDYLGNLSQEEILAGKGATAYEKQADAIIKVAKAQAAKDKIIENEKKRIELIDKLEEAQKKQIYAEKELKEALDNTGGYGALHGDGAGVTGFTIQAKNAKSNVEQLIKELDDLDKSNNKLKGSLNVDDWIDGGGKGNDDPAKETIVSLLDDIEKAKFQLSKQGVEDRIAILELEEQYELSSLDKRLENAKYSEEEKQELILLIQELYRIKREQITEEEQQKQQAEIDKSLEAYTSYEVKRNQIIEKYAKLRENAKGNKSVDVSLIDKGQDEALKKLDKEFGKSAEVLNTVLDLTRASVKKLVEELSNVREKLKGASDAKEVESLQNRIDSILGRLQSDAPFVAFKENLKDAFKDGKVDFAKLGKAIDDILPSLQAVADDSRALFGDGIGDSLDGFLQAVDGFSDLSKSIGSFANGDIAGGVAGLLSAGNKLFGNTIKVNAEHREALRLLKLQREQLEHQYKVQELLKKLEDSKSVFGSDAWGQSRRSAEVYATSIKDLEGSIRKLQDVEVVTGSRKSGWGPWKKRKDVWTPVLEAYPKLIKSSGEFDKTLAENILSTQKLSDEGKFALQSAIDNADTLEQAYTQMSDNLSAVFGDLGSTIMDAFSNAFKGGKDSFEDMFESAGDMLEEFTKQMIYSVTLQPIMEEASKQMMDIQSSSKSDTAKLDMMMEIISSTINDAKNQEDRVNVLLGYAKEQANKQGLDILNDSKDQQSSVGVTKTASQDSIDVLSGRLTHVQETNQEISNNSTAILDQMKTNFTTLNEQMSTANRISLSNMYQIADIVKNTNELYAIKDAVQRIDKNTKGL